MGLDNGIIIRAKTDKGEAYLKKYFSYLKTYYSDIGYEFGYWRKCWNIRQKFIDDFSYDEHGRIEFTVNDIPTIINNTLKYFLNEDNWRYNGETSLIFSWIEELPSIANAMNSLYRFYDNIDQSADNEDNVTDEDFEIYFYDSY